MPWDHLETKRTNGETVYVLSKVLDTKYYRRVVGQEERELGADRKQHQQHIVG